MRGTALTYNKELAPSANLTRWVRCTFQKQRRSSSPPLASRSLGCCLPALPAAEPDVACFSKPHDAPGRGTVCNLTIISMAQCILAIIKLSSHGQSTQFMYGRIKVSDLLKNHRVGLLDI